MAINSKDLKIYLSENLTVNELHDILKTEEQELDSKAKKQHEEEVAYYSTLVEKYVMYKHNSTAVTLFHFIGNIKLNNSACNNISVIKNQSIAIYESIANPLWFTPERKDQSWWFITKDQYEQALKQYNNLTNLIFGYETTRDPD
jgi:hypothetical protein